jgi:hypothetical protein
MMMRCRLGWNAVLQKCGFLDDQEWCHDHFDCWIDLDERLADVLP